MFAEFCQFVRVSRALPTLDFLGTKREEVYTNATETLFGGNKGTAVSSRIVAERSEQREETRSDRSVAVVRTFGGASRLSSLCLPISRVSGMNRI